MKSKVTKKKWNIYFDYIGNYSHAKTVSVTESGFFKKKQDQSDWEKNMALGNKCRNFSGKNTWVYRLSLFEIWLKAKGETYKMFAFFTTEDKFWNFFLSFIVANYAVIKRYWIFFCAKTLFFLPHFKKLLCKWCNIFNAILVLLKNDIFYVIVTTTIK